MVFSKAPGACGSTNPWFILDTAAESDILCNSFSNCSQPLDFLREHDMGRRGIRWLAVFVLAAVSTMSGADPSLAAERPVPLFSGDTKLEPATIEDTPSAIITRVGDRVRDRHAREGQFRAYDHFLPLYWVNRTVSIEIVDRVAKGGDSITWNLTSLAPLNQPNLRFFFEGKGTVAQYSSNLISTEVDPLHYTATVKVNTNERRPIQLGDRIEMEFSPFLKPPVKGRTNYYGTALLYVVGKGLAPWEGRGARLDSFPLPDDALLGGRTTLHRQYSNEPKELFKQMATNIAPGNAQPFVLGRRLHHSDFGTGEHSERGNPAFTEIVGKLGQHHVGRSCVACHTNNGRALPADIGAPMTKYLVRVGSDAGGTPHPKLGSTLQSQASMGTPEAGVTISGWAVTEGVYGDGDSFSLRKPVFKFTGVVPEFFSVRIAPPLVGQGLLEAMDEGVVIAQARETGRVRTVMDPETNQVRLGRFGWKAGQARLEHQIAAALNNDMGVVTSVYPNLDRGSEQPATDKAARLDDSSLDLMVRYVATLGVPPCRDLDDAEASKGEALFARAGCVKCHTPTMKTSAFHPLAELRGQTIRPYTDLLLHDMGPGLADNMAEGNAAPSEWRTPPLWGLGLTRAVSGGESYLHDGRARTLSEAILWHGGEAQPSREAFRTMPATDRAALLKFLQSL
jgi:CxxC motif-containing protein (DUF1111 family)